MSRSIWKGPFSVEKLFIVNNETLQQNKTIFIWSRDSMILPQYIGRNVQIYNGKSWARRKIIEDMVGHKFGEFSYTRKRTVHKNQKIKQTSLAQRAARTGQKKNTK